MNPLHHETLQRGAAAMEKLRAANIVICGAGALGANIAESLARAGCAKLRVIDRDRVEQHNLSTQPYTRADVGAHKARILSNQLFRAVGVEVDAKQVDLTPANVAQLLKGAALVIDAFDNSGSRRIVTDHCAAHNLPCLHAGLAAGYAEVIWNARYIVPGPTNDDVCDYPLARNLVMLAASVACECAIRFLTDGADGNYTITLGDLKVLQME
jgi:molybdopterin/thiamine biosynthesis adenylyltransferase